jgi:hypothetical protein
MVSAYFFINRELKGFDLGWVLLAGFEGLELVQVSIQVLENLGKIATCFPPDCRKNAPKIQETFRLKLVHLKCTKKLQCRKNALMDKNLLLLKCSRVENKLNTAGKMY